MRHDDLRITASGSTMSCVTTRCWSITSLTLSYVTTRCWSSISLTLFCVTPLVPEQHLPDAVVCHHQVREPHVHDAVP